MGAGLDDTFPIDLTAKNVSFAPASKDELSLQLPPDCIYAAQPAGFARHNGTDESTRHKRFDNLNPKVFLEKMSVKVKLTKSHSFFEMVLRHGTGRLDPQVTKVRQGFDITVTF